MGQQAEIEIEISNKKFEKTFVNYWAFLTKSRDPYLKQNKSRKPRTDPEREKLHIHTDLDCVFQKARVSGFAKNS